MDDLYVKLILASIVSFYVGVMATIGLTVWYRKFNQNQLTDQEGINHDYSNFEENFYRGHRNNPAGSGLVSDTQGPAPASPAVEVTDPNENGEIPGYGAQWSCADFGKPNHNYFLCPACNENFRLWIRRSAQRRAA